MFRIGCLLVLLAGSVAVSLAAQSAKLSTPSRIRVKQGPGSSWITGTLLRGSADSLYLMSDRREVAVARDRVTRLDVSQGQKRNTVAGLKNGAIVGGGIGTLLGILVLANEDESWFDYGAEVIPITAVASGILGAALGAGFGTLQITDRWERVEANSPAMTVIVAPGPNGARLGLSARF